MRYLLIVAFLAGCSSAELVDEERNLKLELANTQARLDAFMAESDSTTRIGRAEQASERQALNEHIALLSTQISDNKDAQSEFKRERGLEVASTATSAIGGVVGTFFPAVAPLFALIGSSLSLFRRNGAAVVS